MEGLLTTNINILLSTAPVGGRVGKGENETRNTAPLLPVYAPVLQTEKIEHDKGS